YSFFAGRRDPGGEHDVLESGDTLGDLARLDVLERLARGIRQVRELLEEPRLVEQFLICGIERRGGVVLAPGAFVIAERFIYMPERLVRVEAVGGGLYRQLEFFFGALEIAFFEQIFSFV